MAVQIVKSNFKISNKMNNQFIRIMSIATEGKEQKWPLDDETPTATKLYKTHIETTKFQKLLLSIGSATMAIKKPQRDDMVAVMGETTGFKSLQQMQIKMQKDEEGQKILKDKPRINSKTIDLNYLQNLPENTLGFAYIKFLNDNKVSPDTRMDVQFIDDVELAYVMQRYREIHDLIHTILAMKTNMLGEVAVKWVEAIQNGLPMCIFAALFGPIRFTAKQRRNYIQILPWAINCGYRSRFLMNIYFEKRWEQPIDDLRKEFLIEKSPI